MGPPAPQIEGQARRRCAVGCILVVDDDPAIRDALTDCIEGMGCTAVVAVDGSDALERLQKCPRPCLVLLDLNMPRMNGESFARAVREHETFRSLRIVSMSAESSRLSPPLVEAHIEKPFELEILEASIRRSCRAAAAQ